MVGKGSNLINVTKHGSFQRFNHWDLTDLGLDSYVMGWLMEDEQQCQGRNQSVMHSL